MINPITPEAPQPIVRDAKGRFPKGVSGNPNGANKGHGKKYSLAAIEEGIHGYDAKHKKKYWARVAEIAMEWAEKGEFALMNKLIDKFYPTLVEAPEEDAPEVLPFIVRGPNAN